MQKIEYTVKIDVNGSWLSSSRVREEVNKMFHRTGEIVYVTMSFFGMPKKRTTDQNAYYFGVVVPLVTAGFIMQGNDFRIGSKRDYSIVHDLLKDQFIPDGEMVLFDRIGNKYSPKIKTTTALDTRAFNKYLKDITTWSFDCLGLDIPAPNKLMTVVNEDGELIEIGVEEFLSSIKIKENNI
jgi:hypothetical protein